MKCHYTNNIHDIIHDLHVIPEPQSPELGSPQELKHKRPYSLRTGLNHRKGGLRRTSTVSSRNLKSTKFKIEGLTPHIQMHGIMG